MFSASAKTESAAPIPICQVPSINFNTMAFTMLPVCPGDAYCLPVLRAGGSLSGNAAVTGNGQCGKGQPVLIICCQLLSIKFQEDNYAIINVILGNKNNITDTFFDEEVYYNCDDKALMALRF